MAIFHAGLQQVLDDDAMPIAGGKWKFYTTETTTPATVYADAALTTPLGATVTADSAGRFVPIYLDDAVTYRAVLTTAGDATINDIDPVDNGVASGGSGVAFPVGLYTEIGQWTIPDDVRLIQTSGYDTEGVGAARYAVGTTEDDPLDETNLTTNTANARPVTLAEDTPTLKQFGATGNNLAPDAARNQAGLDWVPVGSTVRATMGAVGGAYKTTSASLNITKPINLEADWGVMFRADNAAGETFPAVAVNPVENLAGGFYAEIEGYFSGTNLIITSNDAGKVIYAGYGLSATGLAAGTHIEITYYDGIPANGTGTFPVAVNNVATTQNLGSVGSPLTIKVIGNDARGMRISGGAYISNPLASTSGYGIAIGNADNNECFSMIGTTIENVSCTGGLGGLYIKGGLGRENQWTSIIRSTVEGADIQDGSDGIQFRDCIISGTVTWDLLEGAFHDGVFSGTAVTRDGCADVINGSRLKFHDVQVEQSGESQQTPYKCQFMLRNFDFPNIGTEIIGCNLGGGLFNEVHVAAYNTRGLVFDRNYLNVTYIETDPGPPRVFGDAWDIYLDRNIENEGDTALPYLTAHNYNTDYEGKKDAYDTIFGYYNRYRGARARQSVDDFTDVSMLLRVLVPTATVDEPNLGKVRMPHRGLWMPFNKIDGATKHGDLTVDASRGFAILIEHSGAIRFRGGFTCSAAALVKDMVVMTLPLWLMPKVEARITAVAAVGVGGAEDKVVSLLVNPVNGQVTLRNVAADAVQLSFANTSWMAVTDPYPTVGP